jgi:hypothetical protein
MKSSLLLTVVALLFGLAAGTHITDLDALYQCVDQGEITINGTKILCQKETKQ